MFWASLTIDNSQTINQPTKIIKRTTDDNGRSPTTANKMLMQCGGSV